MTASPVDVRPVWGGRDLDRFIRLPWRLHRSDPTWVPPLILDVKARLDRKKNPFFEHGEAVYFLAERDGEPLGRIAAIENRLHNETHGDRVGFFGWFDCIDDAAVAGALIEAAAGWCGARGLDVLRGPASFSTNDECGVLVDGFEVPPMLLTQHNPPYYAPLLEGAGCEPVMDLHGFRLPVADFGADRIARIVKKVLKRENLAVRRFDRSDFAGEVERIKVVYNDAWADNWGFVPLTEAEIDHMARDLKPILEPNLAAFVEMDGEPVGFSLVLPNVNEILARMNGRLLPFGIFKLLLGIKKVSTVRLLAMGIRQQWQHRGIDSALYLENFKAACELGKSWSEIGWILDSNTVMINTIERIGGVRYKTWRLFDRPIRR